MTIRCVLFGLLLACRRPAPAESPPGPLPHNQHSTVAGVVGDAALDASSALGDPAGGGTVAPKADLQCFALGPKEFIRIQTNTVAMTGILRRVAATPIPDRVIEYQAVPDGRGAFDLVFVAYGPGDYKREGNRKPATPREQLTPGQSVVARVAVVGNESRIFSRDVDLHTGMRVQHPDNSYPCNFPK